MSALAGSRRAVARAESRLRWALLIALTIGSARAASEGSSAPVVLSIAGSDSGGGAGIQADLKTCEALEVFGTTAVVALTAQNTLGVHAVHSVPVDFVRAQIDAVLGDMGAHAVKTGMLPSAEVIREVAAALNAHGASVRVIDPVIVAATGHVLAGPEAVVAIKSLLIPTATVLTPNMPEAGALLGRPAPIDLEEMRTAANDLLDLGARSVLLKGGRLPEAAGMVDIYADREHGLVELWFDRLTTQNTHGAGCTLAAAIAAELAKQMHAGAPADPFAAVKAARAYVAAVFNASSQMRVGTGSRGPLNHARAPWGAPSGTAGRPVRLSRLFFEDEQVQQIAARCRSNGFLVGLSDGSLPRSTFGGYVAQDKFFLDVFAQAYTLTLARVEPHDSHTARDLAALVRGVVDEIQLHSAYAAQWGVDVSRVTPTPACSRYVDFLLLVARDPNNGIAACAAAMVPCMRLYAHLGRALDAQAKAGDVALALANPYREWIAAYSDDGFEALAARLEALLDRHTASAGEEEVARLRALYVRAMELELGFFDGWSPQRVNTQPDEL